MLSDDYRYAAMATVAKHHYVPRASSAPTSKVDRHTPADGLLQVTQHTEIATMCLLAPEVLIELLSYDISFCICGIYRLISR